MKTPIVFGAHSMPINEIMGVNQSIEHIKLPFGLFHSQIGCEVNIFQIAWKTCLAVKLYHYNTVGRQPIEDVEFGHILVKSFDLIALTSPHFQRNLQKISGKFIPFQEMNKSDMTTINKFLLIEIISLLWRHSFQSFGGHYVYNNDIADIAA